MKRRIIVSSLALFAVFAAGLALGRLGGGHGAGHAADQHAAAAGRAAQVYTCSMHPQVRLDGPGLCPICEMPLIPAGAEPSGDDAVPTLRLSAQAQAMASVETAPVERRALERELRAVGKVEYDETALATITARVDGYVERLFVNFTGIEIAADDHLAEIYSPELLVAQQELLIALEAEGGRAGPLVEASSLKLRRFGLTPEQIDALTTERRLAERITLRSPITGTVIERAAILNGAFRAGDALYRVVNLDSVWVYLEIYEYDLAWVRYGQPVELEAEALPGRSFTGTVTFVQPLVDEASRTVRVPVHVANPDHALTPGMFVSARIRAALGADGRAAPTGVEGRFTCPMHPQVLTDAAGACPNCGMPLAQIPGARAKATDAADRAHAHAGYVCPMGCEEGKVYAAPGACPVCGMRLEPTAPAEGPAGLAVPVSAVLDGGARRLVYVEREPGLYEPREVTLGPRAGAWFPVLAGLAAGDRVVVRGGFLIDSQFQITGHPSLFQPGGLRAPAADTASGSPPHSH